MPLCYLQRTGAILVYILIEKSTPMHGNIVWPTMRIKQFHGILRFQFYFVVVVQRPANSKGYAFRLRFYFSRKTHFVFRISRIFAEY